MKQDKLKNVAMIGYTGFTFDSRVQREAIAAYESGYRVDFYCNYEENPKPFEGINFIRTKSPQYNGDNKMRFIWGYFNFFFFCFFRVTINHFRNKYQVIHVNNMPNFLVFTAILAKLFGAKVILDLHDLFPEIYAEKFKIPLKHWIIRLMYLEERLSANFADEVIVTNRLQIKRLKENKVNGKKFPEILNAADESIFKPFTDHNFKDKTLTIVFPSTLAQRLGLDVLIDAMEIVEKNNTSIFLKIFGGGEYTQKMIDRIESKKLNNTKFMGGVSHEALSDEMENAHIGVIPYPSNFSTNYQMPIKIHEYFTKGLAVVSSDVNIIKEYFPDQVVFFKAGDAEDFADKILGLASNPQYMAELSTAGHAYYKKHTWTRYKMDYIKTLDAWSAAK